MKTPEQRDQKKQLRIARSRQRYMQWLQRHHPHIHRDVMENVPVQTMGDGNLGSLWTDIRDKVRNAVSKVAKSIPIVKQVVAVGEGLTGKTIAAKTKAQKRAEYLALKRAAAQQTQVPPLAVQQGPQPGTVTAVLPANAQAASDADDLALIEHNADRADKGLDPVNQLPDKKSDGSGSWVLPVGLLAVAALSGGG